MGCNQLIGFAYEQGFCILMIPIMLLEEVQRSCTAALKMLKEEERANGEGMKGPRGLAALVGLDEAMDIDAVAGRKSLGAI